jgi:exosome complex component RRP46
MSPELTTHPLVRADGSATFSSKLFTVVAAANGPVEVQRRDELPEEAAIEVNVRPPSGVGGPRERWMESALTSLLRSLLLVHMHPRTLMQVTLQISKEPTLKLRRGVLDVAILPTLANTAFLALVDGGLPLQRTMVATLAAVAATGDVVIDPAEKQLDGCKSIHAMAYSMKSELLLSESMGNFRLEEWQDIAEQLRQTALDAMARAGEDEDEDEAMEAGITKEPWLRLALEESVREASAWREIG